MFQNAYADVFKGDEHWAKIGGAGGEVYGWEDASTSAAAALLREHRARARPDP